MMKNIGKFILLFVAQAAFTLSLFAGNDHALKSFYAGNACYERGDYAAASKEYEAAIALGRVSGPLYFNLANAYFKQGRLGLAILNYERAKRLIPRDGDLRTNDAYAAAKVKYSTPYKQPYFSVDELSMLAGGLFLLFLMLFIFKRRYLSAAAGAGLVIVVVLLVTRMSVIGREAVVIVESVTARFEPRIGATKHYDLYEGMMVDVIAREGGWVKVKYFDARVGWLESKAIEII